MRDERTDENNPAEEAQAAIRDSIERAKELVCEARLAMRQQKTRTAELPDPKH
jgi:hypothetical protein